MNDWPATPGSDTLAIPENREHHVLDVYLAGGELTDGELLAVVCYERYGLGGGDLESADYLDFCAPDAPNFAIVEDGGFAAANIPIKLNG